MSRALWVLFALFIVYATTIPFQFDADLTAVSARVSALSWNPLLQPSGRRVSIPDTVQNVMLFVPFGVLGAVALRRRFRSRAALIVVVSVAALAMSLLVETLQLFTTDRTASTSDLATNATGGFLGAVVADRALDWWFAWMREHGNTRWMRSAWMFPALVALGTLVAFAWSPFDLTLDVSSVAGKVRPFLRDPWQMGPLTDEGTAVMLYALATLVFTAWCETVGVEKSRMVGALVAGALAVGLELSQVFVSSRMPSGWDATVRLLGVGLGALLFPAVRRSPRDGRWLVVLLVATIASACLSLLAPFALVDARQPFSWFPFLGYYGNNWFSAVGHVIDVLLLYFPFGFCLALARPHRNSLMTALVIAFALATGIEYLQSFVAGRYADITDVACSGLGALAGAWLSLRGSEIFERSRRSATVVVL